PHVWLATFPVGLADSRRYAVRPGRGAIVPEKRGLASYAGPPMPSSSFTFSRPGPTFWTAFLILAASVSRVRAQKSSASGLSSICVGSGGVYFAPCWGMCVQTRAPARGSRLAARFVECLADRRQQ